MSAASTGLRTSSARSAKDRLDALRTEFADLAWALERKGRRDAADVVMLIDERVREVADEMRAEEAAEDAAT
jgi:hypothetical protein